MKKDIKKQILQVIKNNHNKILRDIKKEVSSHLQEINSKVSQKDITTYSEKFLKILTIIIKTEDDSILTNLAKEITELKIDRIFIIILFNSILMSIKITLSEHINILIADPKDLSKECIEFDLFLKKIFFDFMVVLHKRTEELLQKVKIQLEESEVRYKDLFDNMENTAVIVYQVKRNGKDFIIKDMNRASELIEKVKKAEVIGKKVIKVFPGIKEFGLYDIFKQVWKTGETCRHPITYYHDNRIVGWRENIVYKLPNDEIVAVYSDITKQKKIEESLEHSERDLRVILDSMHDYIHVVDSDLKILYINEAFKKAMESFGLKNKALGKHLSKYCPFLPSKVYNEYATVIKEKKTFVTEESTIIEGKEVFTETIKIPILENGEVQKIVTVIKDISVFKKTELYMREGEEKYRMLVENAYDGICIIQDTMFLYVNPELSRLSEYSIEELMKYPFPQFIYSDDLPFVVEMYGQHLKGEGDTRYEARIVSKSGKIIDVEFNVNTISYNNKPAILVFIRDIRTKKISENELIKAKDIAEATSKDLIKREDSLKKLLKLKDQFISLVSHDLKVPFQGIIGYSALLLKDNSLSEKNKKFVSNILNAANAQLDYIDKLLNLAYLGSDKFILKLQKVKLRNIVNDSVRFLILKAKKKKINIFADIPNQIYIKADKSLFRQVINNLLNNAIKFTPISGKITISANTVKGKTILKVADTGTGIKPDDIEHIFSEFAKTHRRGTNGEKGTGLGLSISKKIIDAHGFKIEFKTKVNKGTTFIITI
ncbi:PAS domain S-box protein [Candidatus Dependentiae bacterium]|nr:PAS domain S-box protein [Candidatus Dependentiae bacterium]